jgi:hypothetical protein
MSGTPGRTELDTDEEIGTLLGTASETDDKPRTPRRTVGDTDDETDEADEGTDSEEPEEEVEREHSWPCRVAAKYSTNCPRCGRAVSLKTLRYTHMCARTFNYAARALEQQELADIACLARNARPQEAQGQDATHSQGQEATHDAKSQGQAATQWQEATHDAKSQGQAATQWQEANKPRAKSYILSDWNLKVV